MVMGFSCSLGFALFRCSVRAAGKVLFACSQEAHSLFQSNQHPTRLGFRWLEFP